MDLKKIIMIAGGALVLLIIIGVVLFMFVFNGGEPKEEPVVYFEFPLGEMYSNINDESKIFKTSPVIQYTDEELLAELTVNQTRIKNDIFQIYRTRTYDQLSAPNGQQRLREDIVELVIELLEVEPEVISDVYFVEFILQ